VAGVFISESARVARIGGLGIAAGVALIVIGRLLGSTAGFAVTVVGVLVVVATAGLAVAETFERLIDRRHRRDLIAFSAPDQTVGRTRVVQRCDLCARPKVLLGGVWVCAVCDSHRP
jgi:hypothetical protein